MFLKWRLKIRNFFKNNRKTIIIIVIVWLAILLINFLLGLRKDNIDLTVTYDPHTSVLDSSDEVPEDYQTTIEDIIDEYINYCNNGEYENAYNMLSDNCKEKAFDNNEETYEEYIKEIFTETKRYSIQDYSNYDNTYIYNVKIFNDILASGLTGEVYAYYEEKFAMVEEDGEIKLNVGNFIDEVEVGRIVEDDYSKIRIISKAIFYGREEFLVKITNKTDYIMVLSSVYEGSEVLLDIGNTTREMSNSSLEIALDPGETAEYTIIFSKYVDEEEEDNAIIFDKIRILESYSGNEEDAEEEKENAIKLYSLTIPLT